MSGSMKWQVAVLLLQPPLSGAYLLAMRAEIIPPSYVAAILFTAVPGAVIVAGLSALRRTEDNARSWQAGIVALAALQTGWGLVTFAIVSFAIAWRLQ
jgi:hypothetical protein